MNTNNIDPTVSNYIDIAIERERKIFNKDLDRLESRIVTQFKDESKALHQGFQDDIKKAAEMTSSFTTKTDVREIVKEEIRPLEIKVDLIISEIGMVNSEIVSINKKLA